MTRSPLPLAGESAPEIPLYTGDIDCDAWELMRGKCAEEITGGLAYPSKMDCPAWGISATRCRIGAALAKTPGTVCAACYAMKGTFRAKTVADKLERAYQGLFDPRWTPALYALIRWQAKDRSRFFHSGDFQGKNHFLNIMRICAATRDVLFWIPTREVALVRENADAIPENAVVRVSGNVIDGPAPTWGPTTSTVVSDPARATCPSSLKGGNCGTHSCTACWTQQGNVAYVKH
ncbi:GP88 family protein [Frigoriglobus tundricola]|uniref:Gene product 88 domain-containing protein n=1 Tax=Frigoriglobus tundricola TaxID=2774151 RepID=A0A6M5YMV3_9BACT|nr:hypothetical protein [Frigoriglobus tundricola]QJW94623.1 hypothetical protein FTUN_2145 [Frigoriglobus tundricola]